MNSMARVFFRVFSYFIGLIEDWRALRLHRRATQGTAPSSRVQLRERHTDEATIRHMAEAQLGGMSSAESRNAYLRGDNPGGLHQGGPGSAAVKRGDEEESIDLLRDTLTTPSPTRR